MTGAPRHGRYLLRLETTRGRVSTYYPDLVAAQVWVERYRRHPFSATDLRRAVLAVAVWDLGDDVTAERPESWVLVERWSSDDHEIELDEDPWYEFQPVEGLWAQRVERQETSVDRRAERAEVRRERQAAEMRRKAEKRGFRWDE